mgnify:CR=1 FL=1
MCQNRPTENTLLFYRGVRFGALLRGISGPIRPSQLSPPGYGVREQFEEEQTAQMPLRPAQGAFEALAIALRGLISLDNGLSGASRELSEG